ncbi:unnamed protein product [Fraxinus pennsylvanica]|uniref:Uncharacterized protein n=1 Tax=Fraxinus pennsylvanica TaxID=56036 RepID=A0AAD2EAZ9_9LAMI|nr:unnamed protein product [Fraxinus pennsylvanica]
MALLCPLKLPPRLQYDSDAQSISLRSLASTPTSLRTTLRIPYTRKSAWDDDFDPFTVALKKVREEKKGYDHRRSSYHLLFMTSKSKCSSPRDRNKETKDVGRSPKGPKSPRGLFFGGRVRPVQTEREGSNEPILTKGVHGENVVENKVQKVKGLLLRFASFGREKSNSKPTKQTSEPWTPKKFRQSSFRVEGNGKETMSADAKMAVAEYEMPMKPTLALCLGYGIVSSRNMKRCLYF